ncbi:MAG TPA: DUF2911 domain-containing protein [Bryobacteraceae bacterium]|jgi:hypothetical protein|nr:DUF2911 domain-containing protein [Bryobacteraceae bacterium]
MRYFSAGAVCIVTAGIVFSQPPAGVPITDEPPGGSRPAQPPPLSPLSKTSVTINGKKITINYSAPSMRKRVIFGGLVPYDQVWRAGANDATVLHTGVDLEFKGLLVPKGEYSLFVWPNPQQWQLIINKQTGQQGLEYHQERDLGRVPMDMSRPPKPVETYKMTLTKTVGMQGQLKLAWENTVATLDFAVRAPR